MKPELNGALFVVVTKDVYVDFLNGKKYELRRFERRWNEERLTAGRSVVLGCGYSGPRITGVVGDRIVIGSLGKIFRSLPMKKIEPRAKSRKAAVKLNRKLLGRSEQYIAFEIVLEARDH
ncbi:MAG: hypothetical protein Q7S36_00130 [Candidatus Liptonbacteria bacterium]|nr:hypothetical protein [Candidatus Liptonbacteria bacterium]